MQLRDYARILARRWLVVVGLALLGLAAGGAFTALTARVYSAEAKLFVATATTGKDAQAAYAASQFTLQRMSSYTQLSDSGQVLRPVIDSLKLHESVQSLARHVSITNPAGTVSLNVSVTDRQPVRAAEVANAIAQNLSNVIETLEKASATSAPVVVSVTEQATPVNTPVSPRPTLNLALGLISGLVVGALIAILRDQFDTTIKSGADVADLTGRQPVGLIPESEAAAREPLTARTKATALVWETFRYLRANLAIAAGDRLPTTLVVASPSSGEGRTTLACNLAVAAAGIGIRTCLVEADLRRPRVASYLDVRCDAGVLSVLTGRTSLDDSLIEWRDNLSVLLADAAPDESIDLLESGAVASLLGDLSRRFDFVVIDVPPVTAVADGVFVARSAQATLLLARSGKTDRFHLSNAIDVLTTANANIIGVAITGVPPRALRRNLQHVIEGDASLSSRTSARAQSSKSANGVEASSTATTPVDPAPVDSEASESKRAHSAQAESEPVPMDTLGAEPIESDPAASGSPVSESPTQPSGGTAKRQSSRKRGRGPNPKRQQVRGNVRPAAQASGAIKTSDGPKGKQNPPSRAGGDDTQNEMAAAIEQVSGPQR